MVKVSEMVIVVPESPAPVAIITAAPGAVELVLVGVPVPPVMSPVTVSPGKPLTQVLARVIGLLVT